jgi:hypothetical protein
MEGVDNIEQQIEILSKALKSEKARFGRWFVFCCFFAIAVSALAALTNSAWFFAAAGFGWFFVWNRWKYWRLLRDLLSQLPPPQKEGHRRSKQTSDRPPEYHPQARSQPL